MFESFYELALTPFSRDIPTDKLYPSIALEETLGRLEYATERQLFAILTGDCGIGKCMGYLPHSEEWVKGGYETLYSYLQYYPFHGHVMPFQQDTAERLVKLVLSEWEQMYR